MRDVTGCVPFRDEGVPAALQLIAHRPDRLLRAYGVQNTAGDAQRLDELVFLEDGEQPDQFAKVAAVGQLESIEIASTLFVPYH